VYRETPRTNWQLAPGADARSGPWTGPTFRVESCNCWLVATKKLISAEIARIGGAKVGAASVAARVKALQQHAQALNALSTSAAFETTTGCIDRALSALEVVDPYLLRSLLCQHCSCACPSCGGQGSLALTWLKLPAEQQLKDTGDEEGAGTSKPGLWGLLVAPVHAVRRTLLGSGGAGEMVSRETEALQLGLALAAHVLVLMAIWLITSPSAEALAKHKAYTSVTGHSLWSPPFSVDMPLLQPLVARAVVAFIGTAAAVAATMLMWALTG
jgi:hypothetical protein